MNFNEIILLEIFLPLSTFLVLMSLGRYLGSKIASYLAITNMALTFMFALYIFKNIALEHNLYSMKIKWISAGIFKVYWGFYFDTLTVVMLLVVTFISLLVHIYSIEYMAEDPHLTRFMAYLSLFTFFMLMLVTADNLLQLFLGWEGVGLASYLLISFWFTRVQALKAAVKAIIVNRVGDVFLLLAISLCYSFFGTLDYPVIFSLASLIANEKFYILYLSFDKLTFITMCLLGACAGKSAQLGLHTWLPDAMEGPTPVSALIHAATMVTAGVFLLLRMSPLLEYTPLTLQVATILGALTTFFAATTALFQNDLKKVIAYSTCSQLGYMVFACGLSAYSASIFHLANHACFKALLFLCAGVIIHSMNDEQDMRRMGGLINVLPLTYIMMFIASLSLCGFPFLTGFYSKDLILELALGSYTINGFFAYILGTISAFLTASYSMRLLYLTFLCKPNAYKQIYYNAREPSWITLIPLLFLTFLSIFLGYLCRDMFVGLGTNFWGASLAVHSTNVFILNAEFLDAGSKLIPLAVTFSGLFFSYLINSKYLDVLDNFVTSSGGHFI
jgi:NADH-ubiquinone oxidoreductase chain 5